MQQINHDHVVVIWTKIIVYTILLFICIMIFILAPKKVIDDDFPYEIATSLAILEDSNYLLYDYKVYATEARFLEGLEIDTMDTKESFRERNEIMAIKIYGDNDKTEIKGDYLLITSQDTPELNIEYYLVKDLSFDGTNIPNRTFIMLIKEFMPIINYIYLSLMGLILLCISIPTTIKLVKNSIILKELLAKDKSS